MDAYLKGDLTAIVVDYDFYMNDKYSNRMRFSFAHEFGRLFLINMRIPNSILPLPQNGRILFLIFRRKNMAILNGKPMNLRDGYWFLI